MKELCANCAKPLGSKPVKINKRSKGIGQRCCSAGCRDNYLKHQRKLTRLLLGGKDGK